MPMSARMQKAWNRAKQYDDNLLATEFESDIVRVIMDVESWQVWKRTESRGWL